MHFGHKNCLAFDDRPFKAIEEHDQALIDNWNSVVSDEDTVYVLGDMFWCKATPAIEIMKQLKGHKVLIKGNHDRIHDNKFAKCFDYIKDREEVIDGDKHIVLDHYPTPYFKNHFHGWTLLYGHVHTGFEWNMAKHDKYLMEELYSKPCEMYNVGAMVIGYTPRTFDEIMEIYGKSGE